MHVVAPPSVHGEAQVLRFRQQPSNAPSPLSYPGSTLRVSTWTLRLVACLQSCLREDTLIFHILAPSDGQGHLPSVRQKQSHP